MKNGTSEHPKMAALALGLSIRHREAVGIIELLIAFADQYAPRGDVLRFGADELSRRCDWGCFADAGRPGEEPDQLIAALTSAGWLDVHPVHGHVLHDWHQHAPDYRKRKLRSAGVGWAVDDVVPEGDPQNSPENSGPVPELPQNVLTPIRSSPALPSPGKARPGQATHTKRGAVGPRGNDVAPDVGPSIDFTWELVSTVFETYGKRPRSLSAARRRALKRVESEHGGGSAVQAVHGYVAYHAGRTEDDRFDPQAHLTPETVFAARKVSKYLDAYHDARNHGHTVPFSWTKAAKSKRAANLREERERKALDDRNTNEQSALRERELHDLNHDAADPDCAICTAESRELERATKAERLRQARAAVRDAGGTPHPGGSAP